MDTYESRELLPMPFPKKLKEMTDEELTILLARNINYNVLIPTLIEANTRKDRTIAKRKFEDLEQAILAYYEEQEQLNNRRKITLRKFYPEWFQYKWQETNNSNCMKHIDGEWKHYYLDDEIIDKPIIDLTTLDLKNWARNKIVSNHMTKKQYYNMAIIIRQSFDYLVELGDLPVNHFAEFKINASLFTPPKPKEAAERVFIEDEEKKLKQIALKDFEEQKKAESEKTLNL